MKKFIKILPLTIALTPSLAVAANYAIEARGDAMGGVGVVSANFLTAPFYNPALVAIYRRNDDFGMILPSIGISYNDEDKMVDDLDSISSMLDNKNYQDLQKTLDNLAGDSLKAEIGGVVAFAIPNQFIAANLFAKAYTETFATPDIYTGGTTSVENAELSAVNAVSVGVTEIGLSLAKYQTFLGQHIAFGVTPKLQRIYTYVYSASVTDYDIKDVRDSSQGETMFNLDAGALWFYGPLRIGFSATNLIKRDINTQSYTKTLTSKTSGQTRDINLGYAYQMRPLYTVGIGLVADYATLSVDYDLNEEKRYTNFEDNTQMIRIGGEIDILRQLKLRAGYNKNLAYDNLDGTITAGIGISPLNLFQLDLGASYTNENAMGAYINFLASY
ncbi:conjugal transfer protein TraF [Vibrio aestuarianus]|uniref:Conjugal transfer protein TraF n=1 Tax=Vibrio aestuarianus TaxID=28171 RepID=A0A9X4IXL7_9VIBR|nr:conjugal transfer protein TraF [Vibrio aestuarianus]MDE1235054.1 conjugal transfer protein TraF [Vibrio aestuarianus]MDE1246135.1 conjugal transfer protein TraF [Vibrio aestuarianus]MDE1328589.1 conjugal transfer protein TraF [Vibrio aestuarianus]MDE1347248.1 conjugal transfer protein TraF [Vibrio aestuarianus]NGZ64439.1 conjugal transfer protein TraF [Vibrio aestuarianus subsp. cardii]